MLYKTINESYIDVKKTVMNNKTFIQQLSRRTGFTQDDAQKMIYTMLDKMNDQLQEGEAVTVAGFGTFELKKRLERIMTNPQTQQRMLIPPKLTLNFKPSTSLKHKVNEGGNSDEQ